MRELASQLDDAGYSLSPSTLSQWSRGIIRPRLTHDVRDRLFMLERLAWVPAGGLVRALLDTPGHPQVRRAPRSPGARGPDGRPWQSTMVDARQLLLARIGGLFGSDPEALIPVAYAEHHVIGAHQLPVRSEITITVAALTGAPDRYWHIHTTQAQLPITLVAGAGCTGGIMLDDIRPIRVNNRTAHRLAATELHLDRPLPAGREHTFSFTVHYEIDPAQARARPAEFWVLAPTPTTRDLRLSIAFDPAARPRALRRVRSPLGPRRTHSDVATIPVNEDGTSEPIHTGFPTPGWYGYQWDGPTPGSSEDRAVKTVLHD